MKIQTKKESNWWFWKGLKPFSWRFLLKDALNVFSFLLDISFLGKKTFPGTEERIDRNLQEEVNLEEELSLERHIWSNLDLECGLENRRDGY